MRFKAACKFFLIRLWFRICEIAFGASFNFNTEGRELSALRSSSLIMMTIMMTMVMMMMLWRDSAQDAEHAFQLSGCSCTGSHLILLIIFYLFILFIFSLSAHYIYLYLFFIFYLNLLLQGISLQLPYHLLSSVSKYRDGREASILDPTN